MCAIGYRSRLLPIMIRLMQLIQHRRKPLSELFFGGGDLARPLETTRAPFSEFGRTYEACQWSPSSFNAQPTRAAAIIEENLGERRLVRVDFVSAAASRYYAPVAAGIWCASWEYGAEALGIHGRFALVDAADAGVDEPLVYNVSWVLDEPLLASG